MQHQGKIDPEISKLNIYKHIQQLHKLKIFELHSVQLFLNINHKRIVR